MLELFEKNLRLLSRWLYGGAHSRRATTLKSQRWNPEGRSYGEHGVVGLVQYLLQASQHLSLIAEKGISFCREFT